VMWLWRLKRQRRSAKKRLRISPLSAANMPLVTFA